MEAAAGIYAQIMFPGAAVSSDSTLSDMQKAMLNATPDCIKVVSVNGNLKMMNRAGCLALGVPEDSEFGMAWLPLLPEEVRSAGTEALRKASSGQPARFPGKSISPKGIIYWDNLLTPLIDASGQVLSILCVSRDVTEKTLLEKQLEEAVDREQTLAREMHHRVKNLFSVVSGLISISKRESSVSDDSEAAIEILSEKLGALSRASDAVFAQENSGREGTDPVDIETVVGSVLRPYGGRCAIIGSTASIRGDIITTFALLLHELATNSIKYGALGKDDGHVTVCWMAEDNSLNLTWTETCGPNKLSPPQRRGFGAEMVDRVVRSTGGTINRTWRPEGLAVDLHFPSCVQC